MACLDRLIQKLDKKIYIISMQISTSKSGIQGKARSILKVNLPRMSKIAITIVKAITIAISIAKAIKIVITIVKAISIAKVIKNQNLELKWSRNKLHVNSNNKNRRLNCACGMAMRNYHLMRWRKHYRMKKYIQKRYQ